MCRFLVPLNFISYSGRPSCTLLGVNRQLMDLWVMSGWCVSDLQCDVFDKATDRLAVCVCVKTNDRPRAAQCGRVQRGGVCADGVLSLLHRPLSDFGHRRCLVLRLHCLRHCELAEISFWIVCSILNFVDFLLRPLCAMLDIYSEIERERDDRE